MNKNILYDEPIYPIRTAAKLLDVSVHTLRMYEREGLIIPYKQESNQRLYSEQDLERVRCIRSSINDDKISIEGIRRILSLIPCWGVIPCMEEDRKKCAAYNNYNKPCWVFKHKSNYCEGKECRECEVYKSYGNCHSIKNTMKKLIMPAGKK